MIGPLSILFLIYSLVLPAMADAAPAEITLPALLDAIDLSYPGLDAVGVAVAQEDWRAAREALTNSEARHPAALQRLAQQPLTARLLAGSGVRARATNKPPAPVA